MKTKLLITIVFALSITKVWAQDNQSSVNQDSIKERPFQVSFVPGFGTSRGIKEGYTNKFSFNVLAGHEHSLDGWELGGLYNIVKFNVKGAQLAGFGNSVGGNVQGAQFSGIVNTVKGNVQGVQSAGLTNITMGPNRGAQLAGILNLSDSIKGGQLAGIANVSKSGINGAQLAGLANVADTVKGAQVAGLGNINNKGLKGAQVAGLFNTAKYVSGTQLAGLFNKANRVSGTQIALINIADTVERGAVIGLINIVKTGKHQLALEHNDVMDFNLAFRSGTDKLYSILFTGIQAKRNFLWSYGAGFGTEFKLKNKWKSAVELTTQTINRRGDHQEDLNLLNRLSYNFGYRLGGNLSVWAGPVLNVYVTQGHGRESRHSKIYNKTFYNKNFSGTNVKMWVGYNLSIKF